MTDENVSTADRDVWHDLPELLAAAEHDERARDQVLTALYPELKRIAEAQMRRERRDHTLQATALVSEFFVEMVRNPGITARTRLQFLKLASVAMRRLLVDYARARNAEKRGGDMVRVDIAGADVSSEAPIADVLMLDRVLEQLAGEDPRMAQVVELKFFGGMTNAEIGAALGIHERTVKRDWQVARAWLFARMSTSDGHPGLGGD